MGDVALLGTRLALGSYLSVQAELISRRYPAGVSAGVSAGVPAGASPSATSS